MASDSGASNAMLTKQLGYKKVFILNDQELYGKGIADVFEVEAKKIGLELEDVVAAVEEHWEALESPREHTRS